MVYELHDIQNICFGIMWGASWLLNKAYQFFFVVCFICNAPFIRNPAIIRIDMLAAQRFHDRKKISNQESFPSARWFLISPGSGEKMLDDTPFFFFRSGESIFI